MVKLYSRPVTSPGRGDRVVSVMGERDEFMMIQGADEGQQTRDRKPEGEGVGGEKTFQYRRFSGARWSRYYNWAAGFRY